MPLGRSTRLRTAPTGSGSSGHLPDALWPCRRSGSGFRASRSSITSGDGPSGGLQVQAGWPSRMASAWCPAGRPPWQQSLVFPSQCRPEPWRSWRPWPVWSSSCVVIGGHLLYFCCQIGFRRLRAASFFLDAQKETKEAPGRRSGWALRVHIRGPWTPFLRGRQLGKLGSHRKGAGGQRIGFRSITAAAELSVTFGWCFYRLEARLLAWRGSSAAQGDDVS